MVRNPNAWPDAQRRFRLAYGEDPTAFPRTPVMWRVPGPEPTTKVRFVLWAMRRPGFVEDQPRLFLWRAADPVGAPCLMAMDCELLPLPDHGTGLIVGETGVNAVCCLEIEEPEPDRIWPTYNPTVPIRHRKPRI